MNPYQPPADFTHGATVPGDEEASARLRRFAGTWFQVVAWISLTAMIASIAGVFGRARLDLDFSWLLWFWLGGSLKAGSPAARKWAIALSVVFTLGMVCMPFSPNSHIRLGKHEFQPPQPAYFAISAGLWLAFSIPGMVLLGARGRAAFPRRARGKPVPCPDGENEAVR
jgi:hypothetical protein